MNYRAFVEISFVDFAENKGLAQTHSAIFSDEHRAKKWLSQRIGPLLR